MAEDGQNKLQFIFPGGEKETLTFLEGAKIFSAIYLPDLRENSVCHPGEQIDYDLPTQAVLLPQEELDNIAKQIADAKEKCNFRQHMNNVKGKESEINVGGYLKVQLAGTRCAIIKGYDVKFFRRYTTGVDGSENQEFDLILILGEYRSFVVVEVKTAKKLTLKAPKEQCDKGEKFFQELTSKLGRENFENWKYKAVIALPNVKERRILKKNDNCKATIITREEMLQGESLLQLLEINLDNKCDINEEYLSLVQVLIASAHSKCVKLEQTLRVGAPTNFVLETHKKLLGEAVPGMTHGEVEAHAIPEEVSFSSLKNQPLGSVNSILFWNMEQFQCLQSNASKILIHGEYGSGKTLLLMSKLESLREQNKSVVFISCVSFVEESPILNIKGDIKRVFNLITGSLPHKVSDNVFVYDEQMRNFSKDKKVDFYTIEDVLDNLQLGRNDVQSTSDLLNVITKFCEKKLNENPNFVFLIDELVPPVNNDSLLRKTVRSQGSVEDQPLHKFLKNLPDVEITICLRPCQAYWANYDKVDLSIFAENWAVINLPNVMRCTENVRNKANSESVSQRASSYSVTVVGPEPKELEMTENWCEEVLEAVSGEDCFVLIAHAAADKKSLTLFKTKLEERKIRCFTFFGGKEEVEELEGFVGSGKGCLIAGPDILNGMECRTVVLLVDNSVWRQMMQFFFSERRCDLFRCTTNLVLVKVNSDPEKMDFPFFFFVIMALPVLGLLFHMCKYMYDPAAYLEDSVWIIGNFLFCYCIVFFIIIAFKFLICNRPVNLP